MIYAEYKGSGVSKGTVKSDTDNITLSSSMFSMKFEEILVTD